MPETKQRPFSIRVFLPDGDPDGLRVVTKSNWTGVGVVFKRADYRNAATRREFGQTGVYVLVGAAEDSSQPLVYIGEGDPVKPRLDDHYAKKDFWEWGVFFAATDASLNKAHVQYLECRLIQIAGEAKQARLDNKYQMTEPSLSEAEQADMDSFLLDMLSIFPLVGLPVFERPARPAGAQRVLHLAGKDAQARGYEDQKGFVVCAGSRAQREEARTIHNYMRVLRQDLLEQGVLAERDGHYVFTQDHAFNSPSTAAGVVLGRTSNGRVEWKDEAGRTLKDLQAAEAGEEPSSGGELTGM